MLVELSEQLSLKDCFLSEEKAQFIDAGVFKDIQIYIFDLFLIKIVLNHIQDLLVLENFFVIVEYLNVFP